MKFVIATIFLSAIMLAGIHCSGGEEKKVNPFDRVNAKIKQMETIFATLPAKQQGSYAKRMEREYKNKAKLKTRLIKPHHSKINKLKTAIKKTSDEAKLAELQKQLQAAEAATREIETLAKTYPDTEEKK